MPPLIIAHRGDSDRRPENTLASFASALAVGADLVELDVQMTKDGHVVVLHDPTVDRTTDGKGDVRQMSLAEVKALSAGYPERFGGAYRGERVPTLAEALELLRNRLRVMIEIKKEAVDGAGVAGIEAKTIGEVRRLGMEREVALISFSRMALLRCRDQAPDVPRGHLFHGEAVDEVLSGAREVACDLVMPEKGMLSEVLRDRAREAGLRLSTWVVDDPEELRALARFDLYGIASNRPGDLLEAILETE